MRTRIGASVRFETWCAPSLPRGKQATSPSRSSRSPSGVRSVGRPPDDDQPLLVGVVRVVRPQPVARLELVEAAAEQLGAETHADVRVLAAPAGTLLDAVPLVAVEVDDLHGESVCAARFDVRST